MRHYSAAAAVALILAGLAMTGFQCGSAEVTSAKLYMQRSEWDKAEASLVKETQKNPANPESWYLLGEVRRNMKNYAGMVEAFDNSLKAGKDFEPQITTERKGLWGNLLNAGVNQFNYAKETKTQDSVAILRNLAIENYKSALVVNADSAITYYYLGLAYMSLGKVDDEIAALQEGLKHRPTPEIRTSLINAYVTKGQAAEEKGNKADATANYNLAIGVLKDARAQAPDDRELLKSMISLYTVSGRSAEARPYMYEAIARDPGDKTLQYNLGVLLMQDSVSEAINHFEKALEVDPKFDIALQNVGVAYMKRGDATRKKAQEEASGKKGAVADSKLWLPDFKKAAGYFEKLTELKPADANIWDALATAYANANMLTQAKDAMKKADELRKK